MPTSQGGRSWKNGSNWLRLTLLRNAGLPEQIQARELWASVLAQPPPNGQTGRKGSLSYLYPEDSSREHVPEIFGIFRFQQAAKLHGHVLPGGSGN
jgi:hypothetical protein